jgi:3-hydroxyacyl-[acyl-carrier-protein] dehydratase
MLDTADIDLIQRIIPHRYPVPAGRPGRRHRGRRSAAPASRTSPMNEPQFQGHFPQMPVFPGVFMVEAMAQTAAVMVGVGLGLADRASASTSWGSTP